MHYFDLQALNTAARAFFATWKPRRFVNGFEVHCVKLSMSQSASGIVTRCSATPSPAAPRSTVPMSPLGGRGG